MIDFDNEPSPKPDFIELDILHTQNFIGIC